MIDAEQAGHETLAAVAVDRHRRVHAVSSAGARQQGELREGEPVRVASAGTSAYLLQLGSADRPKLPDLDVAVTKLSRHGDRMRRTVKTPAGPTNHARSVVAATPVKVPGAVRRSQDPS